MTVTERLMGVGSWRLSLTPATPRTVMSQIDVEQAGFGHLVVTPTPVDVRSFDDDALLELARYTGVYRSQPAEFELAGAGVNLWVSDEDGKGGWFPSVSTTGGTFAQWAAVLKPLDLVTGIVSSISGAHAKTYRMVNIREPLDEVCQRFGAEWRVNNDLSFDIGRPAELFRMDPTAMIVRRAGEGGRDLNLVGVVGDLDMSKDLDDYAARIRFVTGSQDAPNITSIDGGVDPDENPYRGPFGGPIRMDRVVEDFSGVPGPSVAPLGAAFWAETSGAHRELRLTSRQYDIGRDVRVGDSVFVYDPMRGIADMSRAEIYRGQVVYPQVIRCVGLTWPVRRGMGVYLRRWRKSSSWMPEWIDLTNYVVWESGDTTVEVGAKPRGI